MSIFDKLAKAVLSGGQGGGDIASMITQNPRLMEAAIGLLAQDGPTGGLQGLVAQFKGAGLGDAVDSWTGSGANAPVSGGQIAQALGGDVLNQLAKKAGMTPQDASGALSQALPALIDKLTPDGAPGALDPGDIQSVLGGFLRGKA